MSETKYSLSAKKQILFWGCLLGIVIIIPFLVTAGYFGYKKLNYSFEFGKSFGEFDNELGWTLRKMHHHIFVEDHF